MNETSDTQLLNLAKAINLHIEGLYTRDLIPMKLNNGFYILNIGTQSSGGTHWTGLHKSREGFTYFDSFGAPPPLEVEKAVKRKYAFNNWVVQDIGSNACGYYVLAFGKHMQQKPPGMGDSDWANDFVNYFGEDTKLNEKVIKQYFKTLLG